MDSSEIVAALRLAREYVEARWPAICAAEAVNMALNWDSGQQKLESCLAPACRAISLKRRSQAPGARAAYEFALWRWNDRGGRTKEEVLAFFDKGIARLS